jgi:prepilin-type N-terminal cleavage/methylation domain-containing protein
VRRAPREGGFTLLEVTVAAALLAIVVAFVYSLLGNTVRGTDMVRRGLEAPKVQNAILSQVFRDFRYAWWPDFVGNAGFLGSNRSMGGKDADRVDFVTARPTRLARFDEAGGEKDPGESPLTEVGYAVRRNDEHGEWLELWRREDFFVDDNPTAGGSYTLVYDKIRKFNLLYYPNPNELAPEEKGLDEWDSRIRKAIPYAIILEIWFDVGPAPAPGARDKARDPEQITRIILLRAGAEDAAEWAQPADPQQPAGGMR